MSRDTSIRSSPRQGKRKHEHLKDLEEDNPPDDNDSDYSDMEGLNLNEDELFRSW